MVLRLHRLLATSAFLALALACGPVEYINQVSRVASSEVEAARAVDADKHAPYYFTLALEYLHKAREEAAHSDYQAANRFGKRAAKAARQARKEALEAAKRPHRGPAPVAPATEIELVDPEAEAADDPLARESKEEGGN